MGVAVEPFNEYNGARGKHNSIGPIEKNSTGHGEPFLCAIIKEEILCMDRRNG